MTNPILDEPLPLKQRSFKMRTTTIVIAENMVFLISFFYVALMCYMDIINSSPLGTTIILGYVAVVFAPILYAAVWRQKSIIVDTKQSNEDPQNAFTFFLCVWITIESMILFIIGITGIIVSGAVDYVLPYNYTFMSMAFIYLFHTIKSFNRSTELGSFIQEQRKTN